MERSSAKEGWPAIVFGHRTGIVVSLIACPEHCVVPGGGSPNAVAGPLLFLLRGTFSQVPWPVLFLCDPLLSFQDEMTTAIDINEAGAPLVGVGEGHGPFKTIVVIRVVIGG